MVAHSLHIANEIVREDFPRSVRTDGDWSASKRCIQSIFASCRIIPRLMLSGSFGVPCLRLAVVGNRLVVQIGSDRKVLACRRMRPSEVASTECFDEKFLEYGKL